MFQKYLNFLIQVFNYFLSDNMKTDFNRFSSQQLSIVKLKLTEKRKSLLERKAAGRQARDGKSKDKHSAVDASAPTQA